MVLGEFETIDRVVAGASLSRFGDGELKIIYGAGYSREPENNELTQALRETFWTPNANCLIGIPTMDPAGPKYENWTRHQRRFEAILRPEQVYVSAFVTRPDSAPWIDSRDYAERVQRIWAGKRAVVLCEKSGSMIKTVQRAAGRAWHLSCPRHRAFKWIDRMEAKILGLEPEVAILSCGPTASILANRLAGKGVQAVDLGSAGGFLGRLLA